MNDLAEKALHGLDAARRGIASRPVTALSAAGFVVAAVVVVTGGRIGAATDAVPIGRWFGLQPDAGYEVEGVGLGVVMVAAIGALIALWLLTVRISRVRRFRDRQLWTIAAVWAVPFVLAPPVLSTDVYGYLARGVLARRGYSPYHHAPHVLGSVPVVNAIDPAWRGARSTDGPLATLGEHLVVSVSGGRVVVALLVLRAVAVLSVIAVGILAAELAGPRRPAALCLTALNPALLLFVVSAGNIAGVLGAVLLGVLVAAGQRRWVLAVLLSCVAAGLKPVGLLALAVVLIAHATGQGRQLAWRVALRDTGIAVLGLAAAVFCVPYGLGWIANLSSAASAHVAFAPSTAISNAIGLVVSPASFDDLSAGGRIAAGAAGVVVIAYLLLTTRRRPIERTLGFALLAAGILAPVVYPAFLLWGIVCLAPTAVGARRDWVIALSCAACLLTPVGLGVHGGQYATFGALAVIAVVLLPRLLVRRHNALVTGSRLSAGG